VLTILRALSAADATACGFVLCVLLSYVLTHFADHVRDWWAEVWCQRSFAMQVSCGCSDALTISHADSNTAAAAAAAAAGA
jgi:hypothetical protein